MRKCPFHDCHSVLPESMFCCRRHWRFLTRDHQGQIRIAYDNYLKDRLSIEELRIVQQRVLGNRGDAYRV